MRTLQFEVSVVKAASILSHVLSFFGSLAASLQTWVRLIDALGTPAVDDVAYSLITEAVPIEGDRTLDAHPLRAGWDGVEGCNNEVWFTTPGGVKITVYKDTDSDNIGVIIEFNRESRYAARCLGSRIFEATGGEVEPLTPWDLIEDDAYVRGALPMGRVLTWTLDPTLDPDPDGSVFLDFEVLTQEWVWHDSNGKETCRRPWHRTP